MNVRLAAGLLALAACALPARAEGLRTDAALESELRAAAAGFHGRVGIYVRNLSSGTEAAVDADETFPTASTIKVPILIGLLERVEKGELDYNAELVYASTRAADDGDLSANLKDGAKVTPAKLAWLMASLSDNTAALWCQELAGGGAAVNAWLSAHGFSRTRVNSRVPGREADKARFGWGQTTPREMAELMLLTSTGPALSPAVREEMERVLSKSFWDGEALSQIPPSVHAASKQGAVDHSRSEILLVDAPSGRYALSVYTKNQEDTRYVRENEGYELLRRLSHVVWAHDEGTSWNPALGSKRFYKKD